VETAEIKLTKGAFLVTTTLNDDGVILICRNVRKQSVVVKFDNVLIFQKLSDQELILIKALTLLDKK
jgi:hypothetical protein